MSTLLESVIEQIDNMSSEELKQLNNVYCEQAGYPDSEIYDNDEDFFNTYFDGQVIRAVQCVTYGEYKYSDDYVKFNGQGNLDSFNSIVASDLIDTIEVIAEYAIDNQRHFDMLDFDFDEEEEEEDQFLLDVGNVGLLTYATEEEAMQDFDIYVEQSKSGTGRVAGENIILMKGDDIIKEHIGSNNE